MDVSYKLGDASNVWTEVNTKEVFMYVCSAISNNNENLLISNPTISSLARIGDLKFHSKKSSLLRGNSKNSATLINAESLKATFPELVKTNGEGVYGLSLSGTIPVLLQAIQEQSRISSKDIALKDQEL